MDRYALPSGTVNKNDRFTPVLPVEAHSRAVGWTFAH